MLKKIINSILNIFPLSDYDIYQHNRQLKFSDHAQSYFPYAVEVKNTEKLSIWEALKQAENPDRKGTPLLVFTRNRSDMYCALKFDDFLELVSKVFELETARDIQKEINISKDLH